MSTCIYHQLPPENFTGKEIIKFACQEKPCVDNDVVLSSSFIDTHATTFHNADHISIETLPNDLDDIVLDEFASPT